MQSLPTSRFVLQTLLDELEEFDRDIPVAQNVQVGDVADALYSLLNNRQVLRLTMPHAPRSHRRLPAHQAGRNTKASKRKPCVSRSA